MIIKMKIKHMLCIMLLIFSLIPLLIFGLFMIYENDRRIDNAMRENLRAISGMQILDIKKFCETRKERMEMIAQLSIVHDAIKESIGGDSIPKAHKEYVENILTEQKLHTSFIVSLSIIDKNFRAVASSEEINNSEMSALSNAAAEFLSGDFAISDIYERETPEGVKRVVNAVQGIWEDGELIGYVTSEIETAYFDQNRMETNLWESGTLYIVDGKNNLITAGHPDEESQTEFVTSEKERENYNKAWDAVDHEKNPSGEITYVVDGDEYITYYSDIDYTNWGIRVTANLGSYKETSKSFRAFLILAFGMIAVVMTLVSLFVSKRLTRPISKIAETLQKIQDDQDYSLRVENSKADEVGFLGGKINELLEYIEQENMLEREHKRYLERKAERDPLTGVNNKRAVEERIQDCVQQATENGSRVAVAFVDIDDFKDYNTKYGHQEGDSVIKFVASVLKDSVQGVVGRYGGDEFLFCMTDVKSEEEVENIVKLILQRLNNGVRNKITGETMPIACSIGIVAEGGENISYSSLIHRADEAMYKAKEAGKNTYCLWYDGNFIEKKQQQACS